MINIFNKKKKINDIAIIGFACKFPGAKDKNQFWQNLVKGVTSITDVPLARWGENHDVLEQMKCDKKVPFKGGLIDNVDMFDPGYFKISEERAILMEPQERLILESTAECINHAGYQPEELSGSNTGVFIAGGSGDYGYTQGFLAPDQKHVLSDKTLIDNKNAFVHNLSNMVSAVISKHFNFQGPSFTETTACSSSLTALHLACQSILSEETYTVIVGGIQLYLSPYVFMGTSNTGALSPDGICKTFSKDANGYVLSEGVGTVFLKNYELAVKDGDSIYAVIKSTAVNNDGKTMSVLMPNMLAQEKVITQALKKGNINPATISYLEANGTALAVGDPIEVKALSLAYEKYTNKKQYCAIGSVETNIGHASHAAGMASVIKVILALINKKIPPTLHCEELNPKIDFPNTPFVPNTKLIDWKPIKGYLRAGVSSFGFGGTNGHIILEGFEPMQNKNYKQKRKPFPPIKFNRKRYWLGEEVSTEKNDEKTIVQETNVEVENDINLQGKIIDYIQNMIANKLSISKNDIDEDENFMQMGIDSILLVDLVDQLTRDVGKEISPTILFEYKNIQDLSKLFVKNYEPEFRKMLNIEKGKAVLEQKGYVSRKPMIKKEKVFRQEKREPIAIVGIAGRFPKADNLQEFWQNLEQGKDCISEIPKNRWDWKEYYGDPTQERNKTNIKWGGFIDDVDKFDAGFFNIAPKEAELMDPQQRIFLQCVWQVLYDAGYSPKTLAGSKTGLFVGVAGADYNELLSKSKMTDEPYSLTGIAHSVLPNRISYLLDIHGPSDAIDTACSSSLVAIHKAVESIYSGDCAQAIAGGVNVILTPTLHISASKSGMLSEDGRCKTFDKSANGYVRSEGVGAILLKPLSKAQADGDHIYAVIKGTAENHGGKASSLTAPDPNAQADLLIDAYTKANISPEKISYIECHGTGTSLGDPVEVNGLKKAFQELYKKLGIEKPIQRHCGLGSVKSNIGHLETAAGIAGVIKVLLALKYKKIPATINYKQLNPYIKIKGSPFYIANEIKEWEAETPRVAGVSSFGFGGANAHVVLEEYFEKEKIKSKKEKVEEEGKQLILLSAKNEERLREYVKKWLVVSGQWIDEEIGLRNIAYTLQVGREAMEERLALVVNSKKELKEKLKEYLEGKSLDGVENIWKRSIEANREGQIAIGQTEEEKKMIRELIQHKKIERLAELWVIGTEINWEALYEEDEKPQRISLTTYPFARERYWIPEGEGEGISKEGTIAKLHPMIDSNESTLAEQVFKKRLTGKEFYLEDHKVQGQEVLPGVAYIEMARVSGDLANKKQNVSKIKNIIWASPIRVTDKPIDAEIGLYPYDKGQVEYEVRTLKENDEPIVHSQGILEYNHRPQTTNYRPLSIQEIKMRCKTKTAKEEIYKKYNEISLNYGQRFQVIEELYSSEKEALSKLKLPEKLKDNFEEFILHPSIMDGALQTTAGIITDEKELALPFALGEVEIRGKLTENCYAYVKLQSLPRTSFGDTKGAVKKYDIEILDEEGNVLVSMRDFSVRAMAGIGVEKRVVKETREEAKVMYYSTKWKEKEIAIEEGKKKDTGEVIIRKLDKKAQGKKVIVEEFEHIKKLIEDKIKKDIRIIYQYTIEGKKEELKYKALSGLIKTAHLENPKIRGKIIGIEKLKVKSKKEKVKEIIEEELGNWKDEEVEVKYENGKRYVKNIINVEDEFTSSNIKKIKQGGVYLITGGAGGLGLIFAEYLAKNYKAKLVLIGRSKLNKDRNEKIKKLKELGSEVLYIQSDVSKKEDVERVTNETKEKFGQINGIIHAAGVIRDAFILKKTEAEIKQVITPKIKGIKNIDEVTKEENLDFILLFSSIAGVIGNIGQADYAYANAYLDNFSEYRNKLEKQNKRKGKAIAINWPLWREGGMRVDEETEKYLEMMGMKVLETEKGIQAFEDGLKIGESELIVVDGYPSKLKQTIEGIKKEQEEKESIEIEKKVDRSELEQKTIDYLIEKLSKTTKLKKNQIRINESLEKYGIDSVMIMNLNNQLAHDFGALSQTIFFEYQTIKALAKYFVEEHTSKLVNILGLSKKPEQVMKEKSEKPEEPVEEIKLKKRERFAQTGKVKEEKIEDIAIVGVSGRYPKARNLEKFWEVLKDGKDCIEEIPASRFDWRKYYDPDKNKEGKIYGKWGGFIEDIDKFDPLYFNISPREAEGIEPEERIFLEETAKVLADAGYKKGDLKKVGVYVGIMWPGQYTMLAQEKGIKTGEELITGTSNSSIANRVSYYFNFQGPSIAVDTMCSSSLVTVHMASEAIRRGECEEAIAGGVNLSIHPSKYLQLSMGKFLSTDGRCRSFGEGGDGYVPAEGVGAILLKPLSKAEKDQDHIYGVIKGSTVNHGGKTNGYTVPNPNLQYELIRDTLKKTHINPEHISYIEAHGTGTSLGDPIEITGLTKAFREYTAKKQYCSIGSVKSNMGHLEGAAGIVAVTKVLMQLKYKKIVPNLIHSDKLNTNINFKNSPFKVQQELIDWEHPKIKENGEEKEYPKIAGISSFGAGGTNVHVIIEEYVEKLKVKSKKEKVGAGFTPAKSDQLILLSTKNEERLREYIREWLLVAGHRSPVEDLRLSDIAYTLQVGREAMEERLAVIVKDKKELVEKLKVCAEAKILDGVENVYRGSLNRDMEGKIHIGDTKAGKHYIQELIESKELSNLAELWIAGTEIDWEALYGEGPKPQRVSLPTYPFEKKRYWFDTHLKKKQEYVKEREAVEGENFIEKEEQVKTNGKIVLKRRTTEEEITGGKEEYVEAKKVELKKEELEDKGREKIEVEEQEVELEVSESDKDREENRKKKILKKIKEILSQALYLEMNEIDENKAFSEMGLDSILGVELIKKLNQEFKINVKTTELYDYSNVEKLSEYFSQIVNETYYVQQVEKAKKAYIEVKEEKSSKRLLQNVETDQSLKEIKGEGIIHPKALVLDTVKTIDEITLTDIEVRDPKENEVQILVQVSGVNFPDTMCVEGLYPTMPEYPFIPGFEASGYIVKKGNLIKDYEIGDEVIALMGKKLGGYADIVNVPETLITLKPQNISFEESASLPVAFLTAYYSLYEIGHLKEGEHVLIQTAAGGVGLIAVQLAKLKKAVIYGTSSSAEKREYLKKIGVDYVLDYKGEFDKEIKKMTKGQGVDVVLNMLSGEAIQRGMNSLCPGGRYLEIAVHALKTSKDVSLSCMVSNQSFHSIDLRKLMMSNPVDIQKYLKVMTKMIEKGQIKATIDKVFKIESVKEAFHYIKDRKSIGRIVLEHYNKYVPAQKQKEIYKKTIEITKAEIKDIAIIGLSGRFPGASNINEFWDNLIQGRNSITEVPKNRWNIKKWYDPDPETPNKTYSKWGGFLDDIDKFDPLFFNISPAEAEIMDPQQRLFLEESWKALEDAGYANKNKISNKMCGVYVGISGGDYLNRISEGLPEVPQTLLVDNSASILAARIAYYLNFKGACLAIDTACSSAIVAVNLAVESIVKQENEMAIAGGVNIFTTAHPFVSLSKLGLLSRKDYCNPLDNTADGFLIGEGVGVIVLKSLIKAEQDGDHIYGIIKGIGINQNGFSNGILAPNGNAQADLMRKIYKSSNIDPAMINYIEIHGTGTKLGDAIEVSAFEKVFKEYSDKKAYCSIGAFKSKIGHGFAASGIISIIKAILCLNHKQLPPIINYKKTNSNIEFKDSPFYVNTELKKWDRIDDLPRRCALNSFGFSGTNAHLVLEEYCLPIDRKEDEVGSKKEGKDQLILLSAKNEERLKEYVYEYIKYFGKDTSHTSSLSDIAYTLQVDRESMEERLAIVGKTKEEIIKKLKMYAKNPKKAKENENIICGNIEEKGSKKLTDLLTGKRNEIIEEELMKENDLVGLVKLWVSGIAIHWENLYGEEKPRRISLPTYPFEKRHCWIELEKEKVEKETEISREKTIKDISKYSTIRVKTDAKQGIEKQVKNIIKELLKLTDVELNAAKDLSKFGVDSIIVMQIINRIEDQFGFRPLPEDFLNINTLDELITVVKKKMKKKPVAEISRKKKPKKHPLSQAQKALWLIQQSNPGNYAYNVPIAIKIKSKIDIDALKKAFGSLLKRYENLNVCMKQEGNDFFQIVQDGDGFAFEVESVTNLSEKALILRIKKEGKNPFDLSKGPLVRVKLYKTSKDEYVLLVTVHHIVFDGTSIITYLKELFAIYDAEINGKPIDLPELKANYFDYVNWHNDKLKSNDGKSWQKYWQKELKDELPALNLAYDKPRPAMVSYKGDVFTGNISKEITAFAEKICKKEKIQPFTLFFSIFMVLLYRYTKQEDIIVGTPFAGRSQTRFEELIGYFINMLPIRVNNFAKIDFNELVIKVKSKITKALNNADYPFINMTSDLKITRDKSRHPIFDVAFVFQNFIKNISIKDTDMNLEIIPEIHQVGEFDISLEMMKKEDTYELFWKYNPDLFETQTITRMNKNYLEILHSIIKNPNQKISEIEILTENEKSQLLVEFNDTKSDYPKDKTIHQLFEEQVGKTPMKTAVIFEGQELTYKELEEKSSKLAMYLQEKGVKPDTLVAICVERSLEMIVGIMGILKAGGAYVPLDPEYPEDRIEYMIEDSKAKLVLTQKKLKAHIKKYITAHQEEIIALDSEWHKIEEYANKAKKERKELVCKVKPKNLAYVIYTSGSTGKPKGVLIEHKAILNTLFALEEKYPLLANDRYLLKTTYTFDVSVAELFGWFIGKGSLVILGLEKEKDISALVSTIKAQKITHLNFVPTFASIFIDHIKEEDIKDFSKTLKYICVAGESFPIVLAQKMTAEFKGQVKVENIYGPTEISIYAAWFSITEESIENKTIVPIGTPLKNVTGYILDNSLDLVPIGVIGELYIGGSGGARGYLNRPELTQEKFIKDPFAADPNARLYKTGDLARFLSDGNIEYLGRIDNQVKIRGFRIECGEIETALREIKGIAKAVVIAKEDKEKTQEKRLIGYLVLEKDKKGKAKEITVSMIREELQKILPEYMIPSAFIVIDKIPLTPNGKIDRKALPDEQGVLGTGKKYVAPRNETEKKLVKIWAELLKLDQDKIGLNDDYFELGGNSLLIIQLITKINKVFQVKLPLQSVMEDPTLETLAKLLSKKEKKKTSLSTFSPLVPIQTKAKQKEPTFFFLPDGLGNIACYNNFYPLLKNEYPLYALQPFGIKPGYPIQTRAEDMAEAYIEAIGPLKTECVLIGFSLGGIPAFEMAQQLKKMNVKIKLLVLIDARSLAIKPLDNISIFNMFAFSFAYANNFDPAIYLKDTGIKIKKGQDLRSMEKELRNYLKLLSLEERLGLVKKGVQEAGIILPDDPIGYLKRVLKITSTNERALSKYKFRDYAGRVLYISCKDTKRDEIDNLAIWKKHCKNMAVYYINTDHFSLIKHPFVEELVKKIKERIL